MAGSAKGILVAGSEEARLSAGKGRACVSADTIFALSSGMPPSGVAVIRVSGPDAIAAVVALTGGSPPLPRHMALRGLRGADGDSIDEALVAVFPAPGSFTGEDCSEFQVHGSRAVVSALAEALGSLGLRPAEPGEFTRRALRNEKLSLTQAEGLGDLLQAEAKEQLRLARQSASGALATLYEGWRQRILHVQAECEAELDFSDEDLPPGRQDALAKAIADLTLELGAHGRDNVRAERVRAGIMVVLSGPPNAGKSTLLNLLAKRDVAIVSEEAGTTRDILEVSLDLAGYAVTVVDTAGLREASSAVESEGIKRARHYGEAADILVSITAPGLKDAVLSREADFQLWNKTDIAPAPAGPWLALSLRTGAGVDAFLEALTAKVARDYGLGETVVSGQQRHQAAVSDAATHLSRAKDYLQSGSEAQLVLVAEECRMASMALARILGLVDVEDILGAIFSSFCIGK